MMYVPKAERPSFGVGVGELDVLSCQGCLCSQNMKSSEETSTQAPLKKTLLRDYEPLILPFVMPYHHKYSPILQMSMKRTRVAKHLAWDYTASGQWSPNLNYIVYSEVIIRITLSDFLNLKIFQILALQADSLLENPYHLVNKLK